MAGRAYNPRVELVRDGEPVAAGVVGRPDAALLGNLNYLLDLFDAVIGGEGACRHRATLDPALVPGQAAFWDRDAQRFAPALAAYADSPAGLALAPSCDVVGIVLFKENATLGEVLLAGYGRVDLAPALQDGGPVAPGRYYLSSRSPGLLTQQRPPLSVPVLVADGAGGVYVQVSPRSPLEEHVHYAFRLPAQPAGGNGGTTVSDPDPALPGWLPAGHASFAGLAPPGAAFGYNLAADPALRAVWPPLPIASAFVFWDKGQNHAGATLVPMGRAGLVAVDRGGIWWMSNVAGDVPWPAGWSSPGTPVPPNDPAGPESPRLEEMQITLSFTRMPAATNKAAVTSLRPADGSPLTFRDCNGVDAEAGDLLAGIDLEFVLGPDLVDGGLAVKELDGSTFKRGYVVEGLRAGANCQLSSTNPATRGTGQAAFTLHQGVVTVDVTLGEGEVEFAAQVERLGAAQQRYHVDVPYIGFAPGRQSGVRYAFDLPASGLPTNPAFHLRARLIGRAAGSLPALAATCRVVPRPAAGSATPLPLAAAEMALTFPSAGVAVPTDGLVEVESTPVAVTPGATVLVWLSRLAGDGYAGEVGILRADGVVAGGGS